MSTSSKKRKYSSSKELSYKVDESIVKEDKSDEEEVNPLTMTYFEKEQNEIQKANFDIGEEYYSLKNFSKALIWYQKAADKTSSEAQNMLGWMYHHGQGVPTNYHLAKYWYLQANNTDENMYAQNNIGYLYQYGEGVPKDIRTAISWFTKAANKGNQFASFNLAWVYENEKEFKDLQKAVNLYHKIAEVNNDMDAKERLRVLRLKGYYPKDIMDEENMNQEVFTMMEDSNISERKDNGRKVNITDEQVQSTISSLKNQHQSGSTDVNAKQLEELFKSKLNISQ